MRELWDIMWHRFTIIQDVVSDANARIIAVLFYFTVLMPFGIIYTIVGDPLRNKTVGGKHVGQEWIDREPVPTDYDYARQQG